VYDVADANSFVAGATGVTVSYAGFADGDDMNKMTGSLALIDGGSVTSVDAAVHYLFLGGLSSINYIGK
jgi:hypothetical protein